MAAFIPLELITEILTRLPVKSLNRFKCVSKTWNSIITCSKFIKQHLNQTLISNTTNIIICGSNYLLSSAISDVKLRFDIIIPNLYHILNRPLLNEIPHYPDKIIQSVHGILLMISSSKKTVCLFNPSNKTQRFVPPSPSPKPASDVFGFRYDDVFGFGYDDVTDDYKVVRLVQGETFVYSMRNDSWESVYDDPLPHTRCPHRSGIAVDSTLWFLMISDSWYYMLKCFDLRTSAFSIVNLPEFDSDDIIDMSLSFTSLRGCLCLLVSYLEEDGELLYADAWEINNESKWVKLFKILKEEIDKDCEYLKLVIYSKDMKSVLVEVDGDWFGWYDLVTTKFKRVPVQGLRARDSPYKAHPFVETLVSAVRL